MEFSQVVVAIARGDILKLVALMLGANKLLAIAKDTKGFRPIIVSKVFL
jgi:hypothetical protein